MVRIRELIEESRRRYPDDNFFEYFEKECQTFQAKREQYNAYNEALMTLDDESWNILKEKAIEQFPNDRLVKMKQEFPNYKLWQMKQAFFNTLNEAFAYRYLVNNDFKNVKITKSIDIVFDMKDSINCCEVKTLGISDIELMRLVERKNIDYDEMNDLIKLTDPIIFYENISKLNNNQNEIEDYLKEFDQNSTNLKELFKKIEVPYKDYEYLSDAFINKLTIVINDAKDQIRKSGNGGLIYIFVRFDDLFSTCLDNYKTQILAFCRNHRYDKLIIKMGYFEDEIAFI